MTTDTTTTTATETSELQIRFSKEGVYNPDGSLNVEECARRAAKWATEKNEEAQLIRESGFPVLCEVLAVGQREGRPYVMAKLVDKFLGMVKGDNAAEKFGKANHLATQVLAQALKTGLCVGHKGKGGGIERVKSVQA